MSFWHGGVKGYEIQHEPLEAQGCKTHSLGVDHGM